MRTLGVKSNSIIFIDVDGVLHTRWNHNTLNSKFAGLFKVCPCSRGGVCDPNLLNHLRLVVERTGSWLVLSTAWRRWAALRANLQQVFESVPVDTSSYEAAVKCITTPQNIHSLGISDSRSCPTERRGDTFGKLDNKNSNSDERGTYCEASPDEKESATSTSPVASAETLWTRVIGQTPYLEGREGVPS